ncbi:MAG: class I SAM-dependent methyltransferase [Pseudomonadota bacterium]
MSDFTADWLSLREPLDQTARDLRLLLKLLAWRRTKGALAVVDLGSGSGANLRFLAPHLAGGQTWRLVERDGALLVGATWPRDPDGKLTAEPLVADLARLDLDELLAGADLVTASALLDLAAPAWLARLAAAASKHRPALYITLSYDGRVELSPGDPDDREVLALVNRHQGRDKGLGGPALGPAAADHLAARLEAAGYQVETSQADWRLDADHGPAIAHLVDGWAAAATESAPGQADIIAAWRDRRLDLARRGTLGGLVGHLDLLALWP